MRNHRLRRLRADLAAEMPPQVTAEQLINASLPVRELLLDPILATNGLALLYGPRGLGKTFVAMSIAWAVASGGSFLNWHASRPHRVLYIDGEMAMSGLQARLKLLGSAPPTLKFMIADLGARSLPDLGYYTGQSRLQQAWDDPELVVFDNLSSLVGFRSGDPDCWNELQRFLLMQRRDGRAILLIHHANKKGEQRGINRREDVLDLVMAIRRPADYQPPRGPASSSISKRRATSTARTPTRSRRGCRSIRSVSRAGSGGPSSSATSTASSSSSSWG
jgi:putative DNA primase/helicase